MRSCLPSGGGVRISLSYKSPEAAGPYSYLNISNETFLPLVTSPNSALLTRRLSSLLSFSSSSSNANQTTISGL